MFRAREKELARYHIPVRQSAVLFAIQALGTEATAGNISRWLFRKRHSVSEQIDRMERSGLAQKIRDLHKKSSVRAALTQRGLDAYHKSIRREATHRIMSCLSKEERQQFKLCLHKLRSMALKELA